MSGSKIMPEIEIMISYGIILGDNYLELFKKPCTIVIKVVSMKEGNSLKLCLSVQASDHFVATVLIELNG